MSIYTEDIVGEGLFIPATVIYLFTRQIKKGYGTDGDCWIWRNHTNAKVYTRCLYTHLQPRTNLAHRLAWLIHNKSRIPDGMLVCHRCDYRPCVNPSHLFLGTARDNTHDMINKGRAGFYGTTNGASRNLDESQVRCIRQQYESGEYTLRDLSECYQVHHRTIFNVVKRNSWKWLE